jgi:hypothetical protein
MMNSRLTELHPAWGIRDSNALAGMSPQCWISIRPMSVQGHVWTAPPWQELSDVCAALVGCGHVSGLFVRR